MTLTKTAVYYVKILLTIALIAQTHQVVYNVKLAIHLLLKIFLLMLATILLVFLIVEMESFRNYKNVMMGII
jgi:hypothetical protein